MTMATVMAVAKLVVVRLAYVGIGAALVEGIHKVKEKKNKKGE